MSPELESKVSPALVRVTTTLSATLVGFEKEVNSKLVELEGLEASIQSKEVELAGLEKELGVKTKDIEIELAQWTRTANLKAVTEKAATLDYEVISNESVNVMKTQIAEAKKDAEKQLHTVTAVLTKEKDAAVAKAVSDAALASAELKSDLKNALLTIDGLKADKIALTQQLSEMRASWEKTGSSPVQVYTSSK